MFKKIMVPVDLSHTERMEKALTVAADLAKHEGAEAHLVGVTQSGPTAVADTPEDFANAMSDFATQRSEAAGITFTPHTEVSHDIAVDLDATLERAAKALGADLIVMASHVPGFAEHIFASNAGYLASHSDLSVFVVR
ncbi:MAG: universal stress protein [Pseudomonadota bacterium]